MNSYRCLSDQELSLLEEEFKAFLILNNVLADDWLIINKDNPVKAQELVELFSHLVFEKIVSNSKYLIMKGSKLIHLVKKDDGAISGIWIKLKPNAGSDFSALGENGWSSENLECYTGCKKTSELNKEWFGLLELGYQKTDEITWNQYLNFVN
jgi:hypothetical protein